MNKYYTRAAIDHFLHPRNARDLPDATGVGEARNKADDLVRFYLRVQADQVVEAAFKAQGCAATIAAGSILTEMTIGRSLDDVAALGIDAVDAALGGLPRFKVDRAVVAISALHAALEDARRSRF